MERRESSASDDGANAIWLRWDQAEVDKQMSPSQWSHRMSADAVIEAHCALLKTGVCVCMCVCMCVHVCVHLCASVCMCVCVRAP